MNNETKENRIDRQNKAWRKMLREISYKDKGEVFRKNMFWRIQGMEQVAQGSNSFTS